MGPTLQRHPFSGLVDSAGHRELMELRPGETSQKCPHEQEEPNLNGTTGRPHNRERTKESEMDMLEKPDTRHPPGQGPQEQP
ncbi:hypothetical protein STEG23_018779 [Scotinomys teguina]